MSAAHSIIKTVDITKVYGMGDIQVAALNGVSIDIYKGEFVAIMGPSGSGKSTLMHILGCLSQPTAGQYFLDGEDVSQLDKVQLASVRNQKIGFIFQAYNLLARTTALQNVMLPFLYNRVNPKTKEESLEKAQTMLELVGLGTRMNHQPHELSGGQQQRVAIARALINDPVMVIADEPTGNLDTRSGTEIMNLLHQLHGQGTTIVMVTHDPKVAVHTQRTINLVDGLVDSITQNGKHVVQSIEEASHETR
ncbi:MAG: ABC transporter ATP-binding protein [Anaerolineales bacterium]|nr:ABC transporter ATP-binding protein [Anaerolineales bacterium]